MNIDYTRVWKAVNELNHTGSTVAVSWYRDTINAYYCKQHPDMMVHSDSLGDPLAEIEMTAVNYNEHFWSSKG